MSISVQPASIENETRAGTGKEVNVRNSSIAHIALFGGARIGEIVQINLGDVLEDGIRIRSEKGVAERLLGMPDKIMNDIRKYIEFYRPNTDPTALFTTPTGRMTYDYIRKIVERLGLSQASKNSTGTLRGTGAPPAF